MPTRPRKTQVNWDNYQRSATGIRSFKSRLPQDSVRPLAEEVLERVHQRGTSDDNRTIHNPSPDQIDHLAFALIDADAEASQAFIADALDAGATTDEVYLAYLAGAARKLGEWWTENHVSFMDVTLATSRIIGLLHALEVETSPLVPTDTPSAVFMSVPGETHTLGVQMAADLFRRQGWSIDLMLEKSHEDLVDAVEVLQPAVIGISAGGEHALVALARLIMALRIHCPDTLILVSGAIVREADDLLRDLGPDATVQDVSTAYNVMSDLWEVVRRRYEMKLKAGPQSL